MYRVDSDKEYDSVYCYPNGTLKNKLGIRDEKKLNIIVDRCASMRRKNLDLLKAKGKTIKESGWNANMLKDIHRALMGDIFEWAGEYRTVDVGISYDHVAYESPENISRKVDEVFAYINEKNLFKDENDVEKIKDFALVYGMLKVLQPFRDGNTRTAITFTQLLAGESGMTIDFEIFSKEPFLTNFGNAQISARDNDFSPLVMCFACMVAPEVERPELKMPRVEIGEQGNLLKELEKIVPSPIPQNKVSCKEKESKKVHRKQNNSIRFR